jgi:hypothetical protein
MPGRKVRDAADARACLEAVAQADMDRAAWARAHGVDARSLNAWRLALTRHERPSPPRLDFVELVAEVPRSAPPFLVHAGPYTVEVDAAFDASALRRLLGVVASC